jgi:AraC-like DNA-binding protein
VAAVSRVGPRRGGPAAGHLVALRRARDLADREYGSPLDLDDLARAASLSRFHFVRAFADAYGETPAAYLSRRRIERAKDLLRSANLTITEIGMMVGFTSPSAFSSRFRELVGSSPSDYRRRVTADQGPPPIPGCFVLMWTRPAPEVRNPDKAKRQGQR